MCARRVDKSTTGDFRSTDPNGLVALALFLLSRLSLSLSRRYCYERAVHANVSPANRMFYRLMHVHTRQGNNDVLVMRIFISRR